MIRLNTTFTVLLVCHEKINEARNGRRTWTATETHRGMRVESTPILPHSPTSRT